MAPEAEPVAEPLLPRTIDKVSGRIVAAGPEEVNATQPLLEILTEEAGWDPNQIITRPQWRVAPTPSGKRQWPVDIALFDSPSHRGDPAHLRIICECKRPDVTSGLEQLKVYLDREPHARLGVWFNGVDFKIIYKTPGGFDIAPEGTPIPRPSDPLGPVGARVLTDADLRKAPSLIPVFKRIRDRLAALDRNINRDEEILPDISLLLLLKILDEQRHRLSPRNPLQFQIDEAPEKTAARMKALLEAEVKKESQLFGANGREIRLQVDDDSIHYVVKTLQNYRLLSNETDAVASAFQVIRGKAYKGEEGQYFTPQSVVKVAVAAVNPQPEDRVIDPACGSGSFLAAVQEEVRKKLEGVYAQDVREAAVALKDWSSRNLYAIDKDSVSVRLSKAYLSMLGDGSTHVFKADSIRASGWTQSLSSAVQDGSFDIVVTNPPFGTKLKVSAQIGQEEAYELSREWRRNSAGRWEPTGQYVERDLGLIFLERSIRLLSAGGRLAIVLPDTYLFSDSYGWLVQWLSQFTITHSINVPIEAFEPHCRAKTSIIVLVKAPPTNNHMILGSVPRTFGEDKHGRPRFTFDDKGRQTTDLDDEMGDAAKGFWADHPDRDESRLFFHFSQSEAVSEGILVASYWWRKPYISAVEKFARENDCELVSVGDLVDRGELKVMDGHGSPSSHVHGRGEIPYVKVVDIKNWRVIENPKYAIPSDIASKLRRGKMLQPFDLVTPTRASKNIGLFGVIMPWQTHVILTREIAVWRVASRTALLSPWLLLALMSLKVVHDQFTPLITMQMNREDLGARYRKVLLPLPRRADARERWAGPVRSYIESIVNSRTSYEALTAQLDPSLFADRP